MSHEQRHPLLARQIKRHLGELEGPPKGWEDFLSAIESAYKSAADDNSMLERSLDLSSEELMEANGVLREASQAAEAATKAKSEFLATMSHEIRTPINGIIGMTGLLLTTDLNEEQEDFAATVSSSADSLLAIINDILDFSKLEARGVELESVPCDLHKLVGETMDMVCHSAEKKGLELCQLLLEDVPRSILCDPTRLRQILLNLLSNAIKFTSKGEVSMVVSCEFVEGSTFLRFSIKDTGIGIPKARLQRLFKPFSQVDASTTRCFGGTGLGLAISKRLVDGMQGQMGVDSEEGYGSTFWFSMPLVEDSDSTARSAPVDVLIGRRVLVIDDNATNRKFLVHLIELWGGRADEAVDGPQALRMLEASPSRWDLVYLDYQMPAMNGEQVFLRMQAHPELRNIATVLLTSISDTGLARRITEEGVSGYLTKPIKQAALMSVTTRALQGSHAGELEGETGPSQQVMGSETVAQVVVPQAQNHAVQPAEPLVHVLVAEDDPANQKYVRILVTSLGYACTVVGDGSKAVSACAKENFDLVLMDIMMPVMDGTEAISHIRAAESGGQGRVPIVALTADVRPEQRELCTAAGADEFHCKPITRDDLMHVIERWIPKARRDENALQVEPAGSSQTARAELSRPRVLVVDDQETNRKILRHQLDRLGYAHADAEDGVVALQRFAEGDIALVLLDQRMPRMGGIETVERLRAMEREEGFDPVPVIGLTAGGTDAEEAQFLAAGLEAMIRKPLGGQALEQLMSKWLPTAGPEPQQPSELDHLRSRMLGATGTPKPAPRAQDVYRILLIESATDLRTELRKSIEADGNDCQVVADVEAALLALDEQAFHLVALDLDLPGAVQDVLHTVKDLHLPLVAMGEGGPGSSGVQRRLPKPIDQRRLRAVIQDQLGG